MLELEKETKSLRKAQAKIKQQEQVSAKSGLDNGNLFFSGIFHEKSVSFQEKSTRILKRLAASLRIKKEVAKIEQSQLRGEEGAGERGKALPPSKQLEEEYQSVRGLAKQGEGQLSNPSYCFQRNSRSCLPSIGGAKSSERGSSKLASEDLKERKVNISTEYSFVGNLINKTTVLDQNNNSNDLNLFRNALKGKTPVMNYKGDCLDQTIGEHEYAEKDVETDLSVNIHQGE